MTPEEFAAAFSDRLRAKGIVVNQADVDAFTSAHRSRITDGLEVWVEHFPAWQAQRQRFSRVYARQRAIAQAIGVVAGLAIGVPSLILVVFIIHDTAERGLGSPPLEPIGLGCVGLLGLCVAVGIFAVFLFYWPSVSNSHVAITDIGER